MRKSALLIMLGSLTALSLIPTTVSNAADGSLLYQNKCGACHRDGGEAKPIAPAKYASIQWEKFFKANKHKKSKDIDSLFSESELLMIKDYLSNHAADSDSPEVTGMRLK